MYYLRHFALGFLSLETKEDLIEDLRSQHHLHLMAGSCSQQQKGNKCSLSARGFEELSIYHLI